MWLFYIIYLEETQRFTIVSYGDPNFPRKSITDQTVVVYTGKKKKETQIELKRLDMLSELYVFTIHNIRLFFYVALIFPKNLRENKKYTYVTCTKVYTLYTR